MDQQMMHEAEPTERWGQLKPTVAEAPPNMTTIRQELLHRAAADQRARAVLDPQAPAADRDTQWHQVHRVDADNSVYLAQLIGCVGWLGISDIGPDGAHALWLLVQHTDAWYQTAWLPKLVSAVRRGEADPVHLAMLSDRVATNQQRPQRWGTQSLHLGAGGGRLLPLVDPESVNHDRAQVGLPPLEAVAITDAFDTYADITTHADSRAEAH